MLASPQQSQWRGRAGFSPASLLSLNKSTRSKLLILITLWAGSVSSAGSSAWDGSLGMGLPARSLLHCHPSLHSETVYGVSISTAEWGICCLWMCPEEQIPRAKSARGMTI